jgi:hypothetical protein
VSTEPQLAEFHPEIDKLGQAIADPVLAFYKDLELKIPQGDLRVYAALNALAAVAGMVLAGAGMDPKALQFFSQAVVQQALAQFDGLQEEQPAESTTKH